MMLPHPRIPVVQPPVVRATATRAHLGPRCVVRQHRATEEAHDGDLAARAAQDAEAFGMLYDRYAAQIFRMVHRRLPDRADAEDVTAEVFVKALRAIDDFRPARAPFWGWLHRIAANTVIDHVRARRDALPLEVVADTEDPRSRVEEQALHRVEAARVWEAVAMLAPAQRTAITLRLGSDLPIADVAGRMNRTEGAVKGLLHRGLATLRAQLADGGADPLVA
jgi:RNA polymerase sigma-70 factor (ECF subfamily)